MTKEEFIEGHCQRSNITREQYDEHLVAIPCDCGEDLCEGWASHSRWKDMKLEEEKP
jgi:hypothetical protein